MRVLPADAGMSLKYALLLRFIECAPRRRGDEPVDPTVTFPAGRCSPQTRG